jgi:hypothetical protein
MRRPLRRAWIGVAAGVVAQLLVAAQEARAQQPPRDTVRRRDTTVVVPLPPPADTIPLDSASEARRRRRAARDSAGRDTAAQRTDTLKAPLARALSPVLTDIGEPFYWDRAALFASGALTLLDLLERVPGLTGFRARWIGDPMFGAYLGDAARVRVFHDGIELDPLDVRAGGLADLSAVQLWMLEDVAVERAAAELRVYLRTWRYARTTPNTRTDVLTGDEDTNIYRGFFARRFHNGAALQIAAQQWSSSNRNIRRTAYDADALSLLARVGWARGWWKTDAYLNRSRRYRSDLPLGSIPFGGAEGELGSLDASETVAYLRAAYSDPDRDGPWAQVVASTQAFKENSAHESTGLVPDTVDTAVTRAQYVFTTGLTYRGVRLSVEDRLRRLRHEPLHSFSGRASANWRAATFSAFAERARPDTGDEVRRADVMVRVAVLPFLSLGGGVSQVSAAKTSELTLAGRSGSPQAYHGKAARAEVALRLPRSLWLGGGVLARDSATVSSPVAVLKSDTARKLPPRRRDRAYGYFTTIRGPIWKAVGADVMGVMWGDSSRFYRPRFQTRSQLYMQTNWLRRFPSGNFGIYFGATHEYRSDVLFPTSETAATRIGGSRVYSTLLELRLLQATLSWQFRNTRGERYQLVPGSDMPRAVSVYGVRWDFFN